MILRLAWRSVHSRRVTAALTVLSIALAVALLMGVERIRAQARAAFANAVAGTDLVVGARTSPVHLLLFSVFHAGDANNTVSGATWRAIAARPEVAWTIPLVFGDSLRGHRVVGTSDAFFTHFRPARDRGVQLAQGTAFAGPRDAVLGADAATALGYTPGQSVVLAHGTGAIESTRHEGFPLRVTGVLARTGTPIDRAVLVPLQALHAVHARAAGDPLAAAMAARAARLDTGDDHDTGADGISALLVGLKSRGAALSVQRALNTLADEPLTAVLPGVTLLELWDLVGVAERALRVVSLLVLGVGLTGLLVAMLTSVGERRREMAVLRSVGARPAHVFGLVLSEAVLLAAAGAAAGMALLAIVLWVGAPWWEAQLGFALEAGRFAAADAWVLAGVLTAATAAGAWPAWRSYRHALSDGMTLRV